MTGCSRSNKVTAILRNITSTGSAGWAVPTVRNIARWPRHWKSLRAPGSSTDLHEGRFSDLTISTGGMHEQISDQAFDAANVRDGASPAALGHQALRPARQRRASTLIDQ